MKQSRMQIPLRMISFGWHMKDQEKKKINWKLLATVLFFFMLFYLFTFDLNLKGYDFQPGMRSPISVKAPDSVDVMDISKTEEARRVAAANIPKAYDLDQNITENTAIGIGENFGKLKRLINDSSLNKAEKLTEMSRLTELSANELSTDEMNKVLVLSDPSVDRLSQDSMSIYRSLWNNGVKPEDFEVYADTLKSRILGLSIQKYQKKLMWSIVSQELKPNMFYNSKLSEERMQDAVASVAEYRTHISKGQVIVRAGDMITEQQLLELRAFGLNRDPSGISGIIGHIIVLAFIFALYFLYIHFFRPEMFSRPKMLLLQGIIALIVIALTWILVNFINAASFSGYLAPVAAGSLLTAFLFDRRTSIFVSILLSLTVGIITGLKFNFLAFALLMGMVSIFSVFRLSQRNDQMRAAILNSMAGFMLAGGLEMMLTPAVWSNVMVAALIGFMNGISSSVIAGGLLPLLEEPFGIVTEPKLIELANPSHPLLKRLLIEAPGTYHHSIMVGNLAETAAEAVGGSPLLARVGAYYHDIGKLKRPYFFIENQMGVENPHDKLTPRLSTLVIVSHTKDGAEMARLYRLPEEIRNIIRQHHGDTTLTYFYRRALDMNEKNENILESDFRYSGPRPQSKEAAIVMLADSVEAALRSMGNPTSGVVEDLINRIIREKIQDGQLNRCDLTMREIDSISVSFMRVLTGLFHTRIEYPDESELRDSERKKSNGKNSGNN